MLLRQALAQVRREPIAPIQTLEALQAQVQAINARRECLRAVEAFNRALPGKPVSQAVRRAA
jgi:hypothetical protein